MRGGGKSSSVQSEPGTGRRLSAGGEVLCVYGSVAGRETKLCRRAGIFSGEQKTMCVWGAGIKTER